jgi:hypothetical protein
MNIEFILKKSKLHSTELWIDAIIIPQRHLQVAAIASIQFERLMTRTIQYGIVWRCDTADTTSVHNTITDEFIKSWFPFDALNGSAKKWIA